jgi:transposase InsO family protein
VSTKPGQLHTAIPTWEGFLYLAVILDVFSRRAIGWCMADHLQTELVLGALEMAIWQRHPTAGVIHHSDHGCQYTALRFGARCQEAGIRCSRGAVGDCYDNAMVESFFATVDRGVRTPGPAALPHALRRAHSRFRVPRGLLQSPATPFGTQLPVASRL